MRHAATAPTAQATRLTNCDASPVLNNRPETSGYDEVNRLTGVDYGDGSSQQYAFDNMGNRVSADFAASVAPADAKTHGARMGRTEMQGLNCYRTSYFILAFRRLLP